MGILHRVIHHKDILHSMLHLSMLSSLLPHQSNMLVVLKDGMPSLIFFFLIYYYFYLENWLCVIVLNRSERENIIQNISIVDVMVSELTLCNKNK